MAFGSGVRVQVSYVPEVTRGVTPVTPTMKILRTTERNINLTKGLLETAEVRIDRQIADQRHGFNQVGGTLGFELSLEAYDDMLEVLLGNHWSTTGSRPTTGPINITVTAYSAGPPVVPGTYVLPSGNWYDLGFAPGMTVHGTGFTNAPNNSAMMITAIDDTGLIATVDGQTTAETGTGVTSTASGQILGVSNILQTMTFERRFTDITQYEQYQGVTINDAQLNIAPTAMIGGSFTVLGMSSTVRSGTTLGVPDPAPSFSPMAAFDARLYIDAVQFLAMTSMRINWRNNRQVQPVIGSHFSPDVFDGRCMIDGDANWFLQNNSFLDKYFYNETDKPTPAIIKMFDLQGNYITIIMPRVKINAAPANPPQEGPITFASTFAALRDPLSGYEMIIQRSNP